MHLVLTFRARLSVGLLQIDNIFYNIYLRTFSILVFILSAASLAASVILVVNRASLDCDEKLGNGRSPREIQKSCLPLTFGHA